MRLKDLLDRVVKKNTFVEGRIGFTCGRQIIKFKNVETIPIFSKLMNFIYNSEQKPEVKA